jgi:hypothetical protein
MNNYEYKEIARKGAELSEVIINEEESIGLITPEDIVVPIKKGMEVNFKASVPSTIPKNIIQGDNLGKLEIYQGEEKLLDLPLEADRSYKTGKDNFFLNLIEKIKK